MFVPTTGTINGLSPFTNYTCTILVTTVMDGPMSDPITVRTNESGIARELVNSSVVLKFFIMLPNDCLQLHILQSLTQLLV